MAQFPVAYVGMPITADFWNSGTDNWYWKGVSTSLINNATLTTDPELGGMTLGVGTWRVATLLLANVSPANQAADIKIAYAFTGTASATRRVFGSDTQIGGPSQYFNSSSATHVNTNSERTLMKLGNQAATPGLTTAVAYGLNDTYSIGIQEEMIVTVTVAGDLSLQWAQNAATAGITTTVNAGSYITSRRIA